MKVSMTRICLLAAAPLLAAGSARATDISGTITATKFITQDSKLVGNVTCTVARAACIQFGAGGIKLELKGFTITGRGNRVSCTETFFEDGINTNGKNAVSILGKGVVRRFNGIGIVVGGNDSTVMDVTILSSCIEGIRVLGSRNEIAENSVIRSSLSGPFFAGIFLSFPGGSNHIRGSEVVGAAFRTCSPSRCGSFEPGECGSFEPVECGSFGPGGHGIFVGKPGFPSKNNLIEHNNFSGNPGAGIDIQLGSTGNQVRSNEALGNLLLDDILDANAPGVNAYGDNRCEASRVGVPGPAKNIC